jgi:Cysteine rich repeat
MAARLLGLVQDMLNDALDSEANEVAVCLEDYQGEISNEQCKAEVHKMMERESQDIRFNEPLADHCYEDREKFCKGVQPVRGGCRPSVRPSVRCFRSRAVTQSRSVAAAAARSERCARLLPRVAGARHNNCS